jgi:hypothetical protein
MHLYFVNITVMQGLLKIGCFFFMASVASSVKSHEIIAYFFFPRVFGITCGFSRDFAKNREIWGLNHEIVRKHHKS